MAHVAYTCKTLSIQNNQAWGVVGTKFNLVLARLLVHAFEPTAVPVVAKVGAKSSTFSGFDGSWVTYFTNFRPAFSIDWRHGGKNDFARLKF